MKIFKNIPVLVAAAFIIAAGIGFYLAMSSVQDLTSVMVAKAAPISGERGCLQPFTFLNDSNLTVVQVPKGSVNAWDLTQDQYDAQYRNVKGHRLMLIARVCNGQRIDTQEDATANVSSSLAVAQPGEEVVAVTSTLPAAVMGLIQPGDVINVQGDSGSGGTNVPDAKVLCISGQANGCNYVMPPGQSVSANGSGSGTGKTGSEVYRTLPVFMVLAVPSSDAAQIAGTDVAVALDPYCIVNTDPSNPKIPFGGYASASSTVPCTASSASTTTSASASAPGTATGGSTGSTQTQAPTGH